MEFFLKPAQRFLEKHPMTCLRNENPSCVDVARAIIVAVWIVIACLPCFVIYGRFKLWFDHYDALEKTLAAAAAVGRAASTDRGAKKKKTTPPTQVPAWSEASDDKGRVGKDQTAIMAGKSITPKTLRLHAHGAAVTCVAAFAAADGSPRVASASADRTVVVWDLAIATRRRRATHHMAKKELRR